MAMAMPCAPKVIMEQLCAPSCLRGLQAATISVCHRHVSKDTHDCRHHKKGAPDKPCGVGRADANPKLLLNDT